MRKTTKVTGTKIAQAAKDLNVTSVTIRRYVSEFNIETTTDENGIKVLPDVAMEELKEVRRLKEEGMTNPMVMEHLEERRSKAGGSEEKEEAKPEKTRSKAKPSARSKAKEKEPVAADEESEEEEEEEEKAPQAKVTRKRGGRKAAVQEDEEQEVEAEADAEAESEGEEEASEEQVAEGAGDGRLKHSLTCQTCGKTFEHMNPRLRDCLDCYRAKRKERRRGGDRHKNVIQHPLAQQVVSKMANQQQQQQQQQEETASAAPAARQPAARESRARDREERPRREREVPQPIHSVGVTQPVIGGLKTQVRSYRKAIEETRQITGSLKRRLERPDLPEGDRRWLEQIYAYQLILHQGWRHLSEYRATTNQQKQDD